MFVCVRVCVCACFTYMKGGEFDVVMFLLLSVGQRKRNKIIKEVIVDVKKRREKGRSKSVTNNKSINQSYKISKTSKTKGISKDTF